MTWNNIPSVYKNQSLWVCILEDGRGQCVSVSYQNYQKRAVSNKLTDSRRGGGGGVGGDQREGLGLREYQEYELATLFVADFNYRRRTKNWALVCIRQPFIKMASRNTTSLSKVPKREIFVTELFILSDPIWVGDLRNEPKKPFV
jgi:hypothetical protein